MSKPGRHKEDFTPPPHLIKKIIGYYPLLIRPPYGSCSIALINYIEELDYSPIGWNVMTTDWEIDMIPEQIKAKIIKEVKLGSIITLHDGGGNRSATIEALPKIIEYLLKQGCVFPTIPKLLDLNPYQKKLENTKISLGKWII